MKILPFFTGLLGTLVPAVLLATIGYKLWTLNAGVANAMIPLAIGYLGGWAAGIFIAWAFGDSKECTKGQSGPAFYFGGMSVVGAVVGTIIAAFS